MRYMGLFYDVDSSIFYVFKGDYFWRLWVLRSGAWDPPFGIGGHMLGGRGLGFEV